MERTIQINNEKQPKNEKVKNEKQREGEIENEKKKNNMRNLLK